jgi:Skp family chaperone for outer membrane proteins
LKADIQKYKTDSVDPDTTPGKREQALKRQREIERQMMDETETVNHELSRLNGEAFSRIYREVADAARRIASVKDLELVMVYNDAVTEADFYEPANLQRKMMQPGALMPMVVSPGIDITDDVLAALNAQPAAPKGPRR